MDVTVVVGDQLVNRSLQICGVHWTHTKVWLLLAKHILS